MAQQVCPKLQHVTDLMILFDVEIQPFPIRLVNSCSDAVISIYGLPEGICYNQSDHLIHGKPHSLGHHGIAISARNDIGFDLTGFNITVINYQQITACLKPINHQTIQLGNLIDPIRVEFDDPSAEIVVDGLPTGVEYDPFINCIHGLPDTPGEYRISVRAINKYSSTSIIRFMINVEGIISPSLELNVSVEEINVDKKYHFHCLEDQIIYTFTVKNTGNVPLYNIQLKDTKLGKITSKTRIASNASTKFKYQYQINSNDFNRGSININTVASGETFSNIKIMTLPISHIIQIRGHDDNLLYTKIIKTDYYAKEVKYTLMTANCGNDTVQDIKMSDANGTEITLDKNKLNPNDNIFATIQHKLKHNEINTEPNQELTIMGRLTSGVIIGNKYQYICKPDNKLPISLQLYSNHYVTDIHSNITFVVQLCMKKKISNPQPIKGIIKFYDGIKCLGKSSVSDNIASLNVSDLNIGSHSIYAAYQGDDNYTANGSNILTEFVGDEKLLTSEQLLYIKNHIDKFKKNETTANILAKQHKQR